LAHNKGSWIVGGQHASIGLATDSFSTVLLQVLDDLADLKVLVRLNWTDAGSRGRLLRRVGEELRYRPEQGAVPDAETTVRVTYETPDGTQGFSTRAIATDGNTWRLAVPMQLADLATRGETRVHVPGSADITVELADDSGDVVEVGVIDLSPSGVALQFDPTELPPSIGERLTCRLLQRGDRITIARIEVVHLSCPPGEPIKLGCRFIHARPDAERAIALLVTRYTLETYKR
jgi:hypothetical protein